jgi:uncharacterized damage-inducible protein DinB
MMLIEILKTLFTSDLNKLKDEINLYKNEAKLWATDKDIANSAGNLCLHLIGNLNTFIGAELGKTGYVRQRDLEFSLKNIPREELLHNIDDTIAVVNNSLDKLTPQDLDIEYPVHLRPEKTVTGHFLAHLTAHLAYHLGQINYHRRMLDN